MFQDRPTVREHRSAAAVRPQSQPPTHTPAEALGPLANAVMWEALDLMDQQLNDTEAYRESQRTFVTRATASVSFTLSAGVVTWMRALAP